MAKSDILHPIAHIGEPLTLSVTGETVTCTVKLAIETGSMMRGRFVINLQLVKLNISGLCSPPETFGMTPVGIFYLLRMMLCLLYHRREHPLRGGKVIFRSEMTFLPFFVRLKGRSML